MTTRRRARTTEGRYQGDDPGTPLVDEAWVMEDDPPARARKPDPAPPAPAGNPSYDLAVAAMEHMLGFRLPAVLPPGHDMTLRHLAQQLEVRELLHLPPGEVAIPRVIQHYWRARPL